MSQFTQRQLVNLLCTAGLLVTSSQVYAAAFQLWEQDGASIGNYHAGYAAEANDASTAFYNPAGMVRIPNQQVIFSGDTVLTSFKYRGTVAVNTIDDYKPFYVTAQGGTPGFVPAIQYVTPLTDWMSFGFSVVVPFGLKVDYGKSTPLRYVSTQSSVTVIDISPSLAFKITDKASIGAGPDVQLMSGEFNQIGTFGGEDMDTDGVNTANDSAYGYHLGALYEFTPQLRAGVSYHSQVAHHLTGNSAFTGPLAKALDADIHSDRSKVNITLPPYTALSAYYQMHTQWALMGSVIYTQWSTIQNLILQDVAGLLLIDGDPVPSNNIVVNIPQHFHNTFNFAVGGNYFVSDQITLRGGLGYDQTPVSNAYRNVQMPDNNRYIIALGGHYQASKAIGMDLGWQHVFINKSHIIPPEQVAGAQISRTNGSVTGGADVYGAQVTWNIA